MLKSRAERSDYIQIIRALCIIAVVVIHTSPISIIGVAIRPFVNFCVATFLFLSGYLTSAEGIKSWKAFYKRRIFRVLLPYIIWSMVYTIAYMDFRVEVFIFKLLTGQCCGIYYYIIVYIQLVLITPMLLKLVKMNNWWFLLITPIAIGIQYWLVFKGTPLSFPYNAITCPVWLSYYYFGILARNKKSVILPKGFRIWILTVIIQIMEGFVWYKFGNINMATTQIKISSLLTSFATINLILYFEKNYKCNTLYFRNKYFDKFKGIMVELGDMSFGIYLSHILLIGVLNKLFNGIFPILMEFPISTMVVIFIEIFCIRLIKLIVNRIPANKKLVEYFGL